MAKFDVYLLDPKQIFAVPFPRHPVFRGVECKDEEEVRQAWSEYQKSHNEYAGMIIKEIKKVLANKQIHSTAYAASDHDVGCAGTERSREIGGGKHEAKVKPK